MKDITKELEVRIERDDDDFCYIWIGKKNGDILGHTSAPINPNSVFKETSVKLFFKASQLYKLETDERGGFKIFG